MIILIERFKRTLDSRKYQLQKQIVEALKVNDNDLYSLLKSQWAHRFGVESLEELKHLDLNQLNQNSTYVENQEIDQIQVNSSEGNNSIFIEDNDNQEKELKNEEKNEIESIKSENKESCEIPSYEIISKNNVENKAIKPIRDYKSQPEVRTLIPLPPKPKYGYLKKWLLTSKF